MCLFLNRIKDKNISFMNIYTSDNKMMNNACTLVCMCKDHFVQKER